MLSHVDAEKTKSLVEYSSGSTVISMSIIARILHGIYDTRAYLSNKTAEGRLRLMQFFGLDMSVSHTLSLALANHLQNALRRAITTRAV